MTYVVDASAVLAHVLDEPGGEVLVRETGPFCLSSVNLAEILTKLVDHGIDPRDATGLFRKLPMEHMAYDREDAVRTAALRSASRSRGLSVGDRACLALAQRLDLPVLTGDRKWAELDLGVDVRLIR